MREDLSIAETQRAELEILRCFHSFCTSNTLRYSLCAGTLLGAVRHNGFIPWDDDIDVYMPRRDYELFCELMRDGGASFPPYIQFQNGLGGGFSFPHGKLVDTRYRVELEYTQEDGGDYLGIDVFPLDGVPEWEWEKRLLYRRVFFLRRLLALAYAKPGKGRTRVKAACKRALRAAARLIGAGLLSTRIDRLCRKRTMEDTRYAAPISSTVYGMREYIPARAFDSLMTRRFEDAEYFAIADAGAYLTRLYGHYMEYPEESRRKRHYLHVIKTEF